MKIGLIDIGNKLPNLALMKLSTYYKSQGCEVFLNEFAPDSVDEVFCSVVFSKDRARAEKLQHVFPKITLGGPGWSVDPQHDLPPHIETCRPDFDLYAPEAIYPHLKGKMTVEQKLVKAQGIVNAGLGYTARGCVRQCPFCIVPQKEGRLHQVAEIKDLINPRSNVITLLDNNLSADPYAIEKLNEIRQRGLTVNITQGIDIRLMTDDLAHALSQVKHYAGNLHYAWDLVGSEFQVFEGFKVLKNHIKASYHTCFVLCGFNTTFEEDQMRVAKLHEQGIRPYVMVHNFNEKNDRRLHHYKRYVNSHFFKRMSFQQYLPWIKEVLKKQKLRTSHQWRKQAQLSPVRWAGYAPCRSFNK